MVAAAKPNGNAMTSSGPAQAPPTVAVRPEAAVVGTVPLFNVVESVSVVEDDAVTRATKLVDSGVTEKSSKS